MQTTEILSEILLLTLELVRWPGNSGALAVIVMIHWKNAPVL